MASDSVPGRRQMVVLARVLLGVLCVIAGVSAIVCGDDQDADVASFIDAAKRGDLRAVNSALQAGVDVDATLQHGWTALHAAAERSRVKVLKRLIDAGANVNAKEYLDVTPLHWAAIRGPREAVKALVDAGADVNAYCVQHDTPLGSTDSLEIAEDLIEAGADVNDGRGMTPLALASKYCRVPMIKLLVDRGAKVDDPDDPPLHWAGKPEAAKALLDAGADVNIRNRHSQTALHLTTGYWIPNAETVRLLVATGADVNANSKTNSTPLHEAIRHRQLDIVKVLLANGADKDARDNEGNTPLSLAEEAGKSFATILMSAGAKSDGRTDLLRAVDTGDAGRIKTLIADGADVSETGSRQMTPLHVASKAGRVDIVTELIRAGAKANARNAEGLRPLHLAANAAVAEILIAAGAAVNEPEVDWPSSSRVIPSPMYAAATEGRADVVRALIKHKARLDPRDQPATLVWAAFYGRTDVVKALLEGGAQTEPKNLILDESALHVVARGALADMSSPKHVTPDVRLKIARLLADNGADVNVKADIGLLVDGTPLQCAAMSGHIEMAKLLLDKGAHVNTASPKGTFSGHTPLHGAAQGGHADVAKLLLERRADVNALTGKEHHQGVQTPLDLADDANVIKLLVEHGGKKASELTAGEKLP